MSIPNIQYFPSQRKSASEKTDKWAIECAEAAERIAVFSSNTGIRETYYNKSVNYNLANGIIDTKDVEKVINPLGLVGATFPGKFQNYPIIVPKLNLLIGEESKRNFEWKVVAINPDAITDKEEEKKQQLLEFLLQLAQEPGISREEQQRRVQQFEKFQKYDYMSFREIMATETLNYLWYEQNIPYKFNQGFYDALIAAEEIYCTDIVANEPILRKVNPLFIHTLRSGTSPYIEDADIIVEQSFHPIGYVIDTYYEYLTEKDIKDIEEGHLATSTSGVVGYKAMSPVISIEDYIYGNSPSNLIEVNSKGTRFFSGAYDAAGNIRVTRTVWASLKKLLIIKYFDEFGMQQEDVVSEFYKVDESKGEYVDRSIWVKEWWEATKIGADKFVKIQPRPVQFRGINNLSKSRPGYVGTYYNINSSKVKSLMDMGKPYQYMYDVIMYRIDRAFAVYKGPMIEMDFAKVPEGWDMTKWLYMGETTGYLMTDSFKEGNKGVAQGKLAGNFNTSGKVYNPDMASYIASHFDMLNHIKAEVSDIMGISPQREGAINNRETVGGVERSVLQSSLITEKYFYMHDNLKLRVLSDLLETAKYCWKNKNKKIQYVLSDMSVTTLDIDGELFNETEYGLFVSNAAEDVQLFKTLQGLAPQLVQSEKMNMSTYMKIMRTKSISDVTKQIEEAEMQVEEAAQRQAEREAQIQEAQIASMQQIEEAKMDLARYKIDEDNRTKIEVAEIQAFMGQQDQDIDDDGVPDPVEVASLALENRKQQEELFQRIEDRRLQAKIHEDEISLKREELKDKEKERKSKKEIEEIKGRNAVRTARARPKPKPTSKK